MKRSILALSVTTALLVGCGGGSNGNNSNTGNNDATADKAKAPITKMSSVQANFQTFKTRSHQIIPAQTQVKSVAAEHYDDGESTYVYANVETGEVDSVTFAGKDPETGEIASLTEPTILSVVDLNSNYSAIDFDNVAIELSGKSYSGRYTLIQDKKSGNLYPLVENNQPIYKHVDAEHEAWITSAHFSHTSDESRIYFRHGQASQDGKQGLGLHVAELIDDAFVISKIFDDYHRNNWVLPNGDIISRPWDTNQLIWIEKSTGKEITIDFDFNNFTKPFIFEGKLYIVNTTSQKMVELSLSNNNLVQTETEWNTNGYNTDANNNSVRRGNYEMQANCAVYEFDKLNKTITQIQATIANNGFAPAAGQNSLFCLHSATDDNATLPSFTRFDIRDKTFKTVEATKGTKLDANERMVVISDQEIMFYEYPSGQFTEYYVNLETGVTSEKQTGTMSVIKMQTVAEPASE